MGCHAMKTGVVRKTHDYTCLPRLNGNFSMAILVIFGFACGLMRTSLVTPNINWRISILLGKCYTNVI